VKYFAGLLAVVAVVAGATAAVYRLWDDVTHTRSSDNGGTLTAPASSLDPGLPAPAEGQVFVSGTVTGGHFEAATVPALPTPFTVTTPQRGEGAGATITGVDVNGKTSSIEWDAGRPLVVQGDGGSLLLGPVTVDLTDGGGTITLDGAVHGFASATYTIATPVAVSTGGLGRPADKVTFTANGDSHVVFRGGATVPLGATAYRITGQGPLHLEGALSVAHTDRSLTAEQSLTLDSGTYDLTISPVGGGWAILATLTGPTH